MADGPEAGRRVSFEWDGAEVPGVREKGITLNGEAIDVTSDEDDGWRTLLANDAAENSIEIKLSGVSKDRRLMLDWFNNTRTKTASLTYNNGDVISGTFFLASMSNTGPYNDAVTFEATLQSSGQPVFIPYS